MSQTASMSVSVPMSELAALIKQRDTYRALLEEAVPFVGWPADMHDLVDRIRAALDE